MRVILRNVSDVRALMQQHMGQQDFNEVAHRSGKCRSTVKRLYEGETKSPHFTTVVTILKALGLTVEVKEKKVVSARSRSLARA